MAVRRDPAQFRAEFPRGWQPLVGPHVVVLARPATDGHRGGVATNLLLARDDVPAGHDLDVLADRATAEAATLGEEAGTLASGGGHFAGMERCVRVVSFTATRRKLEVAQVLAFVAAAEAEEQTDCPRAVAQFVGTCARDELARYGPVFAAVIESISVVGAGLREVAPDVLD